MEGSLVPSFAFRFVAVRFCGRLPWENAPHESLYAVNHCAVKLFTFSFVPVAKGKFLLTVTLTFVPVNVLSTVCFMFSISVDCTKLGAVWLGVSRLHL